MLRILFLFALVAPIVGCSETENPSNRLPVNVIDLTDGGIGGGCIQPIFPADEPDFYLFSPPRFLLTTSQAQQSTAGQALVRPGDPVEAEITVNAPTRKARVELRDAWAPSSVISSDDIDSAGNEAIDVVFFPDAQIRGRFYMKITLCGSDCDEQQVVFDLLECPPRPEPGELCGINAPYMRHVFENGELVSSDSTCVDLGGVPGVGSGTVLIQ